MQVAVAFILGLTLLVLAPSANAAPALSADAQAGVSASSGLAPQDLSSLPAAPAIPLDEGLDALDGLVLGLPVAIEAQVGADLEVAAIGPPAPSAIRPAAHAEDQGGAMQALAAEAAPVAAVAVGLAAVGFALRFLLGLLPAGLFSRIDRSQLLDNPVRARVHDAVATEPGVTLSDVQSRAGIAWGTTVHHLRRLEANGLVVSVSQRGHRRYFLANTPAAAQRSALAAILHPTALRIATFVAAQPGTDQSALCHALGLNSPAASKHLEQFRAHGLVTSLRDGRRTRHEPTAGLHAALRLLGEHAAPLVPAHSEATRAPHMSAQIVGLSLAPT